MATAADPLALRPSVEAATARRSLLSRLSAGHLAMLVAALLAFLVNFSVLRSADTTVPVAVAAADIRAGQAVAPQLFDFSRIAADDGLLATLVGAQAVSALDGYIADRAIAAGELLRRSDLRPPGAPADQRAMSVPIGRDHAVGGALAAGDRVDVITVSGGQASYVVTAAEVLAINDGAAPGVLGGGGFSVTIAVDADTALRLAAAIRAEALEVVRTTGAPRAETGAAYTPAAPTRDPAS